MSREIKFRAWHKRYKEMYEVTCIDWEAEFVWVKYYDDDREEWFSREEHFADLELMQYTGMKDKDGVEIYEGDVCRVTHNNSTYEYSATTTIYEVASTRYGYRFLRNNKKHSLELYRAISVEVIGNIYKNPELVEAKKHE